VLKRLVRLRRAAAIVDGLVVVASIALPSGSFPLRRLAPLAAASGLINLEQAARAAGTRPASRFFDGAALLLQVVLLTGLLELSGGPFNPFSVIYAVLIALAALTLGTGWAYLVPGSAIACYAVLIGWHRHLVSLTTLAAGAAHELSTIASKELERTPVRLEIDADNGLFRFVIRDHGRGMSEDTLRRAGEPFYTTKEPGHGLGLGLFLARVFAERCGGSLSLRSGQGTTAILELPVTPSRLEVAS
jgi:hypothetical protein